MGLDDPDEEDEQVGDRRRATRWRCWTRRRGSARRSCAPPRTRNPAVDFEALGAGVENLLNIFQAFSEWTDDQMRAHFAGMRYGDLKKQVAEMVIAHLEPIQQRYREITSEPGYIDGVLREGAERVSPSPTPPSSW